MLQKSHFLFLFLQGALTRIVTIVVISNNQLICLKIPFTDSLLLAKLRTTKFFYSTKSQNHWFVEPSKRCIELMYQVVFLVFAGLFPILGRISSLGKVQNIKGKIWYFPKKIQWKKPVFPGKFPRQTAPKRHSTQVLCRNTSVFIPLAQPPSRLSKIHVHPAQPALAPATNLFPQYLFLGGTEFLVGLSFSRKTQSILLAHMYQLAFC